MEKAKLMLLTTDLKNYEIAESIGINDVNYFSARFKKVVGESPKQYKERVRKADDK
jgi:two-component system response regulator YesN